VKTAISIPDATFERAERRAHELGVSRSQLYSTAVEGWLDSHDAGHVTEQIDQVLAAVPDHEEVGFMSRAAAKLAAEDSQTA
jgi:hypothetical protein